MCTPPKSIAPKLNDKAICVAPQKSFVLPAIISSYFNKPGHYFSTFLFPEVNTSFSDEPSFQEDKYISQIMGRDARIFINNILARLKFEYVILAGLDKYQKTYFDFLHPKKVIIINSTEEVDTKLDFIAPRFNGEYRCNESELSRGLVLAKRNNLKLIIDPSSNINNTLQPKKENLSGIVVLEDKKDVSSVVAANFAYSIDADIECVKPIEGTSDVHTIQKHMHKWKKTDNSNSFYKIQNKIIGRIGHIDFSQYDYATFFTEGLPYSLVVNSLPVSYVNPSLRSDHFIFNSILFEHIQTFESAIVFSPEEFDDEETPNIISQLEKQGFLVKQLTGRNATVRNFQNYTAHYPYDLLHICSHGGETDGYYVIEKFKDRTGKEHTLEYEEVVGFAPVPGKDLVSVHRKVIFRKFNDFRWMSAELRAQKTPNYVFEDLLKSLFSRDMAKVTRIKANYPISGSCHVKCFDSIHQGMFQTVASQHSPVIFNNTCSSWHEISSFFLAGGSRGYVGTLWPIKNLNARNAANHFYSQLTEQNLIDVCYSINKFLKDTPDENIYIYWGLHFTTVQPPRRQGRQKVIKELTRAFFVWMKHIMKTKNAEAKKNSIEAVEFIYQEIRQNFSSEDLKPLEKTMKKNILDPKKKSIGKKEHSLERGVIDFPEEVRKREDVFSPK